MSHHPPHDSLCPVSCLGFNLIQAIVTTSIFIIKNGALYPIPLSDFEYPRQETSHQRITQLIKNCPWYMIREPKAHSRWKNSLSVAPRVHRFSTVWLYPLPHSKFFVITSISWLFCCAICLDNSISDIQLSK